MADYTNDCRQDLERKKQGPATVQELREFFCGSCRNIECEKTETGPNDPMGRRARLQEERLLRPVVVDPRLPQFAPLAQQDFADAKEAAEAWDVRRPAPQASVPDFGTPPIRPELLAQRAPASRKILRGLPGEANTEPPRLVGMPQRPDPGPDPWDPGSGGRVVESGATVRLTGTPSEVNR